MSVHARVLIARSIAGGKLYSQAMQTMRVIKRQQSRVQRALRRCAQHAWRRLT